MKNTLIDYSIIFLLLCLLSLTGCTKNPNSRLPAVSFTGEWVEGDGDQETLDLIDQAFRSMHIAPDMATVPLLYKRDWDGFVEGHYWVGWWLQNSFGPTYGMLPFWSEEPYKTWFRHS